MTRREYSKCSSSWLTAFYSAMFEDRVRYTGGNEFEGMSLIHDTLPRQLHLDF